MGRYFPLFGEEWGVYFFARKSLVSGATVARIVDGIRDGSVVQDTLPRHRLTRGDFSGLGEPSIASPRQTSKLRSVSQRDGTSARATSTPRGAISEREYLFLYLFISLLEIYQDVLSVARGDSESLFPSWKYFFQIALQFSRISRFRPSGVSRDFYPLNYYRWRADASPPTSDRTIFRRMRRCRVAGRSRDCCLDSHVL